MEKCSFVLAYSLNEDRLTKVEFWTGNRKSQKKWRRTWHRNSVLFWKRLWTRLSSTSTPEATVSRRPTLRNLPNCSRCAMPYRFTPKLQTHSLKRSSPPRPIKVKWLLLEISYLIQQIIQFRYTLIFVKYLS